MTSITNYKLFGLIAITSLFAAGPQAIYAGDDVFYTKNLYDEKLYDEAVYSSRKFIFSNPSSPEIPEMREILVKSLWRNNNRSSALTEVKKMSGSRGWLLRSKIYFLDKDYDSAIMAAEKGLNDPSTKPESLNIILASRIHTENWKGAGKTLLDLDMNTRNASNILSEDPPIKLKSATTALAMSAALPGLGQAYSEHYSDAIVTLLLNGIFIGGSIYSWNNDYRFTSILAGSMGLTYYLGNLYNAGLFVYQYNNSQKEKLDDDIRKELGLKAWFSF